MAQHLHPGARQYLLGQDVGESTSIGQNPPQSPPVASGATLWPDYAHLLETTQARADHFRPTIHVVDPLACVHGFAQGGKDSTADTCIFPLVSTGQDCANTLKRLLARNVCAAPVIPPTISDSKGFYASTCLHTDTPYPQTWIRTAEALNSPALSWRKALPFATDNFHLPDALTVAADNMFALRHELWHALIPAHDKNIAVDSCAGKLLDPALARRFLFRLRDHGYTLDAPISTASTLRDGALFKYRRHLGELVADCGALLDMAHHELSVTGQLRETPAVLDAIADIRAASFVGHMLCHEAYSLPESSSFCYGTHMAMPYLRVRLQELAQPDPTTGQAKLLGLTDAEYQHEVVNCARNGLSATDFADVLWGSHWLQRDSAGACGFHYSFSPLTSVDIAARQMQNTCDLAPEVQALTLDMLERGKAALERISGGQAPDLSAYMASITERMDYVGPAYTRLVAGQEAHRLLWEADYANPNGARTDLLNDRAQAVEAECGARGMFD